MVIDEDSRPLWVWENEGGARHLDPARRKPRPPQDTADYCDAMAAAGVARAAAEVAGWSRTRLEHSAVMWSRRARSLEPTDGSE
jgi:hypothetical protein